MHGRVLLALPLAVAIAAAPIIVAVPASAATGLPLEFSLDGTSWARTIPELVPASWQPVPGSIRTETIHVRSTRDIVSRVALYVGSAQSPSASLLRATSVTGRLDAIELAAVDSCRPLDGGVLAPGESATFTVSVGVAASLTDAPSTPLSFELAASMSDLEVEPVGPGCPATPATGPSAGGGGLPATGGDGQLTAAMAAGGVAALFLGIWALLRRRRRDAT